MSAPECRLAVVTGASNGIGAAIADRLVREGLQVIGVDVDQGVPGRESMRVDLADPDAVERAADALTERGVDVLVNCAGIYLATPLDELDAAAYQRVLAIDLHAPVLLISRLGRAMGRRGWGRIVSITSVHTERTEPGALAYAVAKAGLEAATRVAAIEFAERGVLVNAVAPGFVATRMALVDGVDELDTPGPRQVYVEHGRIPLLRGAQPAELAGLVCWLASPDNTYVTGQSVRIDGGLTVRL